MNSNAKTWETKKNKEQHRKSKETKGKQNQQINQRKTQENTGNKRTYKNKP